MRMSVISPNLSGCCSILDIGVTCLATFLNERTKHQANIIDYTFKKDNWQGYLQKSQVTLSRMLLASPLPLSL